MDEIKLTKQKEKGAQAEAILNSDVFKEAVRSVSDEYFDAWTNTAPNDTIGRENLWRSIKSLDKIVKHIRIVAENGRLATKDLADIKYLKR